MTDDEREFLEEQLRELELMIKQEAYYRRIELGTFKKIRTIVSRLRSWAQ